MSRKSGRIYLICLVFFVLSCDEDILNCHTEYEGVEFKRSGQEVEAPSSYTRQGNLSSLQYGKNSVFGLFTVYEKNSETYSRELDFWRIFEYDKDSLEFIRELPGINYVRGGSFITLSVERDETGEDKFFVFIDEAQETGYVRKCSVMVYDYNLNLISESKIAYISIYSRENENTRGRYSPEFSVVNDDYYLCRFFNSPDSAIDKYGTNLDMIYVSPIYLVEFSTGIKKIVSYSIPNFDYEDGYLFSAEGDFIQKYELDVSDGSLQLQEQIFYGNITSKGEKITGAEASDFIQVTDGKAIFSKLTEVENMYGPFQSPLRKDYQKDLYFVDLATGVCEARFEHYGTVSVLPGEKCYIMRTWNPLQRYLYFVETCISNYGDIFEVK